MRERLAKIEAILEMLVKDKQNQNSLETKIIEVEACSKSILYRLKSIEDNNTWIWRTIGGTIIVAVLTFLFKKG